MKKLITLLSLFSLVVIYTIPQYVIAADDAGNGNTANTEQKEMHQFIEKKVESDVKNKVSETRKKVMEDAVDAITKTKEALKALDAGDTDKALSNLELVTGKLVLIVARDPDLALAPVDVSVEIFDLYADVDTINNAKQEVIQFLKEGDVQDARSMISGLASEIIISETSIPLVTYPIAIEEIVPLIEQGKVDEAKKELEDVLNTLVQVDHVIPLPIVRAQSFLTEAEKLSQKSDRNREDNKKLADLLKETRTQLTIAEALGYGSRSNYSDLYKQLDELEMKTSGKKSGTGLFDEIKESLKLHLDSIL